MKKLLFTLSILVNNYICSYAQIIYHDINPDTTVSTWDQFTIAPATSSATDIEVWWHPSIEVVIVTNGDCELLFNTSNMLPAKLDSGDVIGPSSGLWKEAIYDKLDSGSKGNWQTDATDKYIAFRFRNSTTWYYGWLKMTVAPGAVSFTVKEWAYNASGNQIKGGQTTTTAVNTIKTGASLSLYPNPAQNTIQFGMAVDEPLQLSIVDINMRTISALVINKGHDPIVDITNLPNGVYYIRAIKGDELYTSMFVKQ